jgi:hypothetical protein
LRRLRRIGLVCLLCAGAASAADLAPVREGDRLGAHVRGLQFPDSLRKDLRSGLTNRVLIRIELLAESRVIDTRMVELAVKYDLWDEVFRLTVTPGQGAATERVFATEDQVLAILRDVALPQLFDMSRLAVAREHGMRCDVLVNPIEKERLAMVRKWVAENSVPTAAGVDSRVANAAIADADSADLFNRIFEQFSSGSDVAAAWRESAQSRPFRPEAVPNEGK